MRVDALLSPGFSIHQVSASTWDQVEMEEGGGKRDEGAGERKARGKWIRVGEEDPQKRKGFTSGKWTPPGAVRAMITEFDERDDDQGIG